jgi:hypothetical protein
MSDGTGNTAEQRLDTRIGTLAFTHDFAGGYPTRDTVEKLYDERDFQRACQAYLWALPLVSFEAWQQAQAAFGAGNGEIVAYLSYEDRLGIVTANATTPYYLAFGDLSAGPLVVDMPPHGVLGGILDFWQRTIPDTERPAQYLVVGPGQDLPDDVAGFEVRGSKTMGVLIGIRITVIDAAEARDVLSRFRVYPYAQRGNPPSRRIVSPNGRPWNGGPPRGLAYWERLHDAIQREPAEERDRFFYAMLKPLGIAKGLPFTPDERQVGILAEAALVGEAMAKTNTFERRFSGIEYRPGTRWHNLLLLDADDPDDFWNHLDERAAWFYEAVTATTAMAPKRPGPSSAYLGAYQDKAGDWLDGSGTYRLRVPADPPVSLFWSLTAYDVDTRCLIRNEEKIADRSSRMNLRTNDDGSVDVYCGPNPPAGFEANWIPTVPGRDWFAYFRFYGPTQPYFDRSWPLGDFERVG